MFNRVPAQNPVMSLFRRLGQSVEKTKQAFTDGSDADYRCETCEQPVEKPYDYCPHCGEASVTLIDEDEPNN